jgi:prepilin-type N-terminal cleavage/methylation domain-containing protein
MKTELDPVMQRSVRSGFTLIEIMFVVTIIAILASVAIPSFVRAIETARARTCALNLKGIDGAKVQWAAENKKPLEAVPADEDLFGPGRFLEHKPDCPSSGTYTLKAVEEKCTCSVRNHVH